MKIESHLRWPGLFPSSKLGPSITALYRRVLLKYNTAPIHKCTCRAFIGAKIKRKFSSRESVSFRLSWQWKKNICKTKLHSNTLTRAKKYHPLINTSFLDRFPANWNWQKWPKGHFQHKRQTLLPFQCNEASFFMANWHLFDVFQNWTYTYKIYIVRNLIKLLSHRKKLTQMIKNCLYPLWYLPNLQKEKKKEE